MELFVSGVAVPKLGSIQDVMARQYLTKRSKKEVALNSLMAHMASEIPTSPSPEWRRSISNLWNNYVNMAYFLEDELEIRERDMQEEFERWRHVRPTVHKDKNGRLIIKGLLDNNELRSKI